MPKQSLITSVYTDTVKVCVAPLYSIIEEESSLITVTQLIIAPATTPGSIIGRVTSPLRTGRPSKAEPRQKETLGHRGWWSGAFCYLIIPFKIHIATMRTFDIPIWIISIFPRRSIFPTA